MANPEISNYSPDSYNVISTTNIVFDITDADNDLDFSSIIVNIENQIAFSSGSFNFPFNGPSSSHTVISNGFRFTIDNLNEYSDIIVVMVFAKDVIGNEVFKRWSFSTGFNQLNTLYFSDGYGIKKIYIKELVGESQSKTRIVLDKQYTNSSFIYDNYNYLSNQYINGDFFLIASRNIDAFLIKNEVETLSFSVGKEILKSIMDDKGTLFLINKTDEQIDVYYDSYLSGSSVPDFIYNISSTPPILSGVISDIYLDNNFLNLYIGTDNGVSQIQLMPDGYESLGNYYEYTISNNLIGGTSNEVVSIGSDEDILLITTDDGYGNAGLTQDSISLHQQISYFDGCELPSTSGGNGYLKGVFGRND